MPASTAVAGGHTGMAKAAEKKQKRAKRVKPRAIAVTACAAQLEGVGDQAFGDLYGSFDGCVADLLGEAKQALDQAVADCGGPGAPGFGRCVFEKAMEALGRVLGGLPGGEVPLPPGVQCPIDLPDSISLAGLSDLQLPDFNQTSLPSSLRQQIEGFEGLQQRLNELLAMLQGQSGFFAQLIQQHLAALEQQLNAVLPEVERRLNELFCAPQAA